LIPQAWQFELRGKALRRGLSGSAWKFEVSAAAEPRAELRFELRRCRGAAGDESGEARAE